MAIMCERSNCKGCMCHCVDKEDIRQYSCTILSDEKVYKVCKYIASAFIIQRKNNKTLQEIKMTMSALAFFGYPEKIIFNIAEIIGARVELDKEGKKYNNKVIADLDTLENISDIMYQYEYHNRRKENILIKEV